MEKATWVFALAGAVGLGMLIGTLDRQSAEVTASIVREVSDRQAMPPAVLERPENRLALRLPLGFERCDAVVASGYYASAMTYPRCYVRGTR